MKKKVLLFFALFACCVVISDFLANHALTNANGAPNGHTGSPENQGRTCQTAGCHTSGASVQNGGQITSNIPATGYIPGNTYTLTASITGNSNEFGFQVSPQDNVGAQQRGTLVSTSPQTRLTGGTRYITHSLTGTSGTGSKSWSFDWVAPTGNGDVVFYGAFLISNNNGATSGDTTKTTTLVVSKDATIKDITSFRFNALNPQVAGTIDTNAQTIELTVPPGTDVTNIVPTIIHTGDAINPPSGIANDFSSPQTYTATAQNGSTKSYTVSVSIATTVIAYDLKHSFEIYPNPVSDKIFIKQSLHNKIARITVINKNGKIVKDFISPDVAGHFDVADLSPGVYFIKAETEKGRIIKKIIKQ